MNCDGCGALVMLNNGPPFMLNAFAEQGIRQQFCSIPCAREWVAAVRRGLEAWDANMAGAVDV